MWLEGIKPDAAEKNLPQTNRSMSCSLSIYRCIAMSVISPSPSLIVVLVWITWEAAGGISLLRPVTGIWQPVPSCTQCPFVRFIPGRYHHPKVGVLGPAAVVWHPSFWCYLVDMCRWLDRLNHVFDSLVSNNRMAVSTIFYCCQLFIRVILDDTTGWRCAYWPCYCWPIPCFLVLPHG